jgi:hypothetical protein
VVRWDGGSGRESANGPWRPTDGRNAPSAAPVAPAGETVLVTDRDRVVAELVSPRHDRSPLLQDAMLAEAVRNGWLTPPLLPPVGAPPQQPVASAEELLNELAADREDR